MSGNFSWMALGISSVDTEFGGVSGIVSYFSVASDFGVADMRLSVCTIRVYFKQR